MPAAPAAQLVTRVRRIPAAPGRRVHPNNATIGRSNRSSVCHRKRIICKATQLLFLFLPFKIFDTIALAVSARGHWHPNAIETWVTPSRIARHGVASYMEHG